MVPPGGVDHSGLSPSREDPNDESPGIREGLLDHRLLHTLPGKGNITTSFG